MKLRSSQIILCVLALVCAASGATLEDYRARLNSAAGQLRQLGSTPATPQDEHVIRRVLTEIPRTEKVEWQGGSVDTDNAWLAGELNKFLTEEDAAARGNILDGSVERLVASADTIADVQRGNTAGSTKDADKQKLAEILRREEYQPPTEEQESLFQRWWKALLRWIESIFPSPKLTPGGELGLGSLRLIIQIVVFAAAAGLIGFLLWKFLPYFSTRFGKGGSLDRADRVILGELVSANESASDIFDEAERLAKEGDIRGAIRKGYIAVLCELGDRRLVRLAGSKTNRDYLRDVRRTPAIYDGLSGLTSSYESNWYGLRAAEPEDWSAFREGYARTLEEPRRNNR